MVMSVHARSNAFHLSVLLLVISHCRQGSPWKFPPWRLPESGTFTTQNGVFQISRKFSEMKHVSPSILGKQVDVREVESHLPPVEIHLPEQNHQEALEDVAADGEYISTLGLFVIWSICWAKSLRLGKKRRKSWNQKSQNADISQSKKSQNTSGCKGPQEVSSPISCLKLDQLRDQTGLLWDLCVIGSPGQQGSRGEPGMRECCALGKAWTSSLHLTKKALV